MCDILLRAGRTREGAERIDSTPFVDWTRRVPGVGRDRRDVQRILGCVRLLISVVGVGALIGDLDYVQGFTTFATANWFSYFTTQSGMAGVVVFAFSGVWSLSGRVEPRTMAAVHAVVVTYVVVSGIVFGLILLEAGAQRHYIEVPWSSRILHFVIPAYALLDWIIAPGRPRVAWPVVGWSMLFPVAWCVFTEIRGPRVGWYPYFFLDPAQVGVPFEIAAWMALVAGVFAVVASSVVGLSRVRAADPVPRPRGSSADRRGVDPEVDARSESAVPATIDG